MLPSKLLTKEDFYKKTNELILELKAFRKDLSDFNEKMARAREDRITRLEEKTGLAV